MTVNIDKENKVAKKNVHNNNQERIQKEQKPITLHSTIDNSGAQSFMPNGITNPDDYA